MGLFDLFKKKSSPSDGLSALRQKVEDHPRDARLAQDLAQQLKARGQVDEAVEYMRRSAQAHRDAGFGQRAAAALKSALSWGAPTPDLYEDLAATYLQLELREDAREALVKLRALHREAGRLSDSEAVGKRIAELGPGR